MSCQQQLDATWRNESAQALLWALGLLPGMPPYDTNADPELIGELPRETARGFIKSAQLRPQTQIDRARDLAELWHWRSRTRQLIEKGEALEADENMKAAGFHSFDDIVRVTAQKAFEKGNIQACIGMDFPVKGRAYRDRSPEEWSEVTSITAERHFALNWLCGYAPRNRWDETPTDT